VRIIIPVVLCAAAALTSCQKTTSTNVRVDPALATLVPADTAILVGARLDKLRETPIYQKRFSQVPMPRLDEFAKQTGLDPRRDVWEVLFASSGGQTGVLMARGKFPTGELEPKLEREGATRTAYKGYTLFGDDRNAAFFMNSSTALAGSTPVLKAIIDNRDRSGSGIPEKLAPLVEAVPSGSQFWAVFSGSAINLPFPNESNLGNLNQIVRSIQAGRFSADLTKGLELQANGTCNTDEDARRIHDFLKGLIGLGRLSTPDNQPEMLKMYDSIEVNQQARVVNLSANVPQDVVDRFLNTFVDGKRR
jgi:hypothetical protein